jgi:uncharacterized damage-inducible protein DinB
MNRKIEALLAAALLVSALAAVPRIARADDPSTGVKGEVLTWIKDAQVKLEDLAAAMPESKYSWRPGKGVRSVGEVFMHVAAANYGIPAIAGVKPPEGFPGADKYEQSLTKKADIEKALHDSFVHMETAWTSFSDADLEKPVDLFGSPTTVRGAYLLVLSHCHEHLGQSIAYARTNGVVPPWTAKQQAAAKEMEQKKTEAAKK